MEIILGKTAGFCYGVKRAVEGAKEELNNKEKIYCLGELVHNQSVVENLKKNGIIFINDIYKAKDNIIIRAHGEKKETYKVLKERNIEIKDLTCPNVIKTHDIAEEYSKNGYYIILIGIKEHPESIATLSYCGENARLIQEIEDINDVICDIEKSKKDNILIMAQTTYNSKKFDKMVSELKEKLKNKNVEIKKTICGATEIRQKETTEISKKVDAMIIIGGKKSSNTNKLCDISKENCSKVLFVQNSDELDTNELNYVEKIGIMAGASTPKEDIDNVIRKIEKRNEY